MALRQNSNKMTTLGKPKPISGQMYGGAQGRPMMLHNAATGSVGGGLNAGGTSAIGRSASRNTSTSKPSSAPKASTTQKKNTSGNNNKNVKVDSSKIASMYRDSLYKRNMGQLLNTLQNQLSDLAFQQRTGAADFRGAKRDLLKQNMVDRMRANAAAGIVGGGGDVLIKPTIVEGQQKFGDLTGKYKLTNAQLAKQMNLAKQYYNQQKLAEEGLARERYSYKKG